jgi:hypothetical protein
MSSGRKEPEFLSELRRINGGSYPPGIRLSEPEGFEFIAVAQWLYVPEFFEYRGGVFVSGLPLGFTEQRRKYIDNSLEHFDGNLEPVENLANLIELRDIFIEVDLDIYYDDMVQVGRSVRDSWEALLKARFPDRDFYVHFSDDDPEAGPLVTFHTICPG